MRGITRNYARPFLAGGIALGSIAFVPDASAFVLISKTPRRLESTPASPTVTFKWNESSPTIEDKELLFDGANAGLDDVEYMAVLLQLAMDQWNEVHGSYLRLAFERDAAVTADTEDGTHAITVSPEVPSTAGAFARWNYQVGGNESNTIGDCDIYLSQDSVSATVMAQTLVHEIGHCIGLGHNHTNYDAIMGYARAGKSFRLGADDKAGAIWLYPDPAVSAEDPQELVACGVVSGGKHDHGRNALVSWMLMALPVFVAAAGLRRKRKT